MRLAMLLVACLAGAGCFGGSFQWPDPQPHACDDAQGSGLACTTVWEGLSKPSQVLWHDGVLYVAQQDGKVWRMDQGVPEVEPVLDISDKVATCHIEQGLLGLAFAEGKVFVAYTEAASCSKSGRWGKGDLILARHEVRDGRAHGEAETLLRVPEPYRNHNGGHIAFGPDGMLYLGVGDGGDHGDPLGTGSDPSDLLASILRLDVSGTNAVGPADNPFVGGGGDPRVLHYGLRNPWRFAFDDQGGLWIADVGQDCYEEVSYAASGEKGLDFGWSRREGPAPYPNPGCQADPGMQDGSGPRAPVWSYGRDQGCSIVGGPVVPDEPLWASTGAVGAYLAADFCTGRLWAVHADGTAQALLDTGLQVTAMGLGPDGLYVAHWGGSIHRVAPIGPDGGTMPATRTL